VWVCAPPLSIEPSFSEISTQKGQELVLMLPPHIPPFNPPSLPSQVSFEVSDCCKRDFPDASFDVVISRDTLLHVADKETLFQR
jgi:hypothetical protein